MRTISGAELPNTLVAKYVKALTGQFYKILPIKESGEPTLCKYMESFQRELIGCKDLIAAFETDELFLSLISILQYLIEAETDVATVKSEVFKAIRICEKLQKKYCAEEIGGVTDG